MTIAEIKNQIALKENELKELKKLLKQEERKTKSSYSFVKHQYKDNDEEEVTKGMEHICVKSTLRELIRNVRYNVKKAKKRNRTIWYELLNNDTNKVELIIE